jgi:hypothetical protein
MTDEIFRLLFEALKGSIRLLHKPKKKLSFRPRTRRPVA